MRVFSTNIPLLRGNMRLVSTNVPFFSGEKPFFSTNIPFLLVEACDFSMEIDLFSVEIYDFSLQIYLLYIPANIYAECFPTVQSIVGKCIDYNKPLFSSGRSRLAMQEYKRTCYW